MPRVPTYDTPQVSPNTTPANGLAIPSFSTPTFRGVDAPTMPDVAGRQAQQMGAALSSFGDSVGHIADNMAAQANQLRVDDALNQAKEAALKLTYDKDSGFTNLKGINALQRPDGKPLADEYGDNLKQQLSSIAGTLGNDAQRQAFDLHSNDILTAFRGQAIQHEAGEFKNYALSTSEGIQSTALRDIGLNWNNPSTIDSAVERIQAETYRQAQLLGKSAEWQEAQSRKMTSNAHKTALMTALEQNDPAYADSYLKKYSDQMDADDILAVRGHITKSMDARVAMNVATALVGNSPVQASEGERAFNIAIGTESGGKQFAADGSPLTSPKGAIGIAQVMPTTAPEAAKLANLPWDENRYKTDPAYNRALGMAYFQKQLQDNGGDLAKAYAAYNAGPGAVQKAVAQAKDGSPDGGAPKGNWLSFLPQETQAYVTKNMSAFNAGAGQPTRPTFMDIDAQLRANPLLANNPTRYKLARETAQQQFDEQTKAIQQNNDAAVTNAMRGVMQNGGRYTDLPVAIRAAIPPEKIDDVINFAQKISKGDDTTSLWLYNKLTNEPTYLKGLSDDQFFALRSELNQADFKHFSDERAKLTGAVPSSNGPGDLNTQAIKQTLDGRMRILGIDPTPKDDGGTDAARIGAIRQFVDQYFYTAQREAGKKFSDAEVSQHIDALFAKNATFRGWFSNSSGPMLGMKAGDIDGSTKDSIKAAYKKQGVDDPTDAQILTAYWNLKVSRK